MLPRRGRSRFPTGAGVPQATPGLHGERGTLPGSEASHLRRRRLMSPARADVSAETFSRPVFADFTAYRELLDGQEWPDLAQLNAIVDDTQELPRFVAQTPELLADGLHYEQRIAERRQVATRVGNWHDLLNAIVWLRYPQVKLALNARQMTDIARVGPRARTRGQCALTLFDEGGLVVLLRCPQLLEAWDAHDWPRLFGTLAERWRTHASVRVFGHALLEHALDPGRLLVGKALVIDASNPGSRGACEEERIDRLVASITDGSLLADPQELRPLPIDGIPGWSDATTSGTGTRDHFLRTAECFRSKAEGRVYPAPLRMRSVPTCVGSLVDSARGAGRGAHARG